MSKSIAIFEKNRLTIEKLIIQLDEFFVKIVNEDQLLLSYNQKWIWFFIEDEEEHIYSIQFSNELDREEIFGFIDDLHSKISYKLIDISV